MKCYAAHVEYLFSKTHFDSSQIQKLILNDQPIEVVQKWCYLGFYVKSGSKFSLAADDDLCSFYRASNTILNVLKKPNEIIQMKLLYSNCVPILTYGSGIKEYSASDMSRCNTAINNSIRKIFSFRRFESVRTLREQCGYKSIYEIFTKARNRFFSKMKTSCNSVLRHLYCIYALS